MLNDSQVRKMLLDELNAMYDGDPNTRIINELGIDFGSSRIDVAVVNGMIHGYEIKSDVDTLERLPRQMEFYNKLFQRVTIVASRKFYDRICTEVPKWWGIKIISADNTRLINKRKGGLNNKQDKNTLLRLLWKKDLEELVDRLGFPKKMKRMKKHQLLELFSQEADMDIVREFTYKALVKRENWR